MHRAHDSERGTPLLAKSVRRWGPRCEVLIARQGVSEDYVIATCDFALRISRGAI